MPGQRRDKGSGSVFRDGRQWVARVDLGRDADGKRIRMSTRSETEAEARADLERMISELQTLHASGIDVAGATMTVGDFLDQWLASRSRDRIKEKTRTTYRETINTHIKPYVGKRKVGELKTLHVEQMLAALEARGLSASTRRNARQVLGTALTYAQRHGLVVQNVARLSEAPPNTRAKIDDTLTDAELAAILEGPTDDRLHAMAVVCLLLGLRSGEVRALRWSDIDFDAGVVRVDAALTDGRVRATTKTANANRNLPIPSVVAAALKKHRKLQAAEALKAPVWHNDEGYVFTTTIGTPLDRHNALRWWKRLCEQAGIPPRRLHAARHTAATWLLQQGVPLEVVSAVLGHASLSITADIYAEVRSDAMRSALSLHDHKLQPPSSTGQSRD
jgi:integrase